MCNRFLRQTFLSAFLIELMAFCEYRNSWLDCFVKDVNTLPKLVFWQSDHDDLINISITFMTSYGDIPMIMH